MYFDNGNLEYVASVYGWCQSDAGPSRDMGYIVLYPETSRRLPFSNGTGYNSRASVSAQMVVMVFGSHEGGGRGIIGTENGAFGRTGTTIADGITTNTRHSVWVDGVQVDPTAANVLNGSWQVIAVSMDGEPFNGLGWNNYAKDSKYGGQRYGEIMIFTEPISERQRIGAEIYLAEKWGLSAQYAQSARARLAELGAAVTNRVAIRDRTVLKANGDSILLTDVCSGTLELSGGEVKAEARPYRESEIPSEGRIFWLDADDEQTLVRWTALGFSTRTNQVVGVRNKSSATFVEGEPIAFGQGMRAPVWVKSVRGSCPERGWLDFNEWYTEEFGSDANGNCLRFYNYKDGIFNSTSGAILFTNMNVQTAIMAQDSSHGGGLPISDRVTASPSMQRQNGRSDPIWGGGYPSVFANGENRLNGNVIDQANGFTGEPEVFTVRGTGPYNNAHFIDYYGHTENRTYDAGKGCIIGELIYYSTALSDDVVAGIEAYLMRKWLQRLPNGFADMTGLTVSGTGSVLVTDASTRPQLAATFSGECEIAGDGTFDMSIDPSTGEVAGTVVAPSATFSFPATCTINVDFLSVPPKAESKISYTLVECQSIGGSAWTVNCGSKVPAHAKILQTANKIELEIPPKGMMISIK